LKSPIKPGDAPDVWSADALYAKALRYVEKMGEAENGSWEHALWSALTLELLVRAALANVSPALLADLKNWNNLLHSLGFNPTESRFSPKSIAISEAAPRLRQLVQPFDKELEAFCITHTGRRNAELHSGENAFEGVTGWQPQFYNCCIVLLDSMGISLEEFVGQDEADAARKIIAASQDEAAKAILSELEAHRKVWGNKDPTDQARLISAAMSWATKEYGHRVICPSCGSPALVKGDPITAPNVSLKDDQITETQEFLPNWFQCIACGFKISGLSKLNVVGLGDRYKKTQVFDAVEYYKTEDEFEPFEDDNNEPL